MLDQGLPREAAGILRANGWNALHVGEIGMGTASDRLILERAVTDQRVVVTLDASTHRPHTISLRAQSFARNLPHFFWHLSLALLPLSIENRAMNGAPNSYEKLDGWRVCRIDPVFSEREYGHWWIEVGQDESYGFWPEKPVGGLLDMLLGVPGAVNPPDFSPSPRRDLHHGEQSSDGQLAEFDVWVPMSTDLTTLLPKVRDFAKQFVAKWAWPATRWTGENCHTFQEKLLKRFNLHITKR